ncbi:MAG: DUF192 domain-containing protein [Candidatus Aenigmatarchaeota archaeon]
MAFTLLAILSVLTIFLVILYFNFYSPSYKTVKIKVGNFTVTADLADSMPKMIKGLMGRKSLSENRGMLFIFGEKDKPSIWMMNMSIPIDIIWMDSSGKVTHIVKDAQPCFVSCKTYSPEKESKYVLEVSSNFTDRHDIKIGTKIEIPL